MIYGRSASTSLAEIHYDMSDLFDKLQKEFEEILPGFMQAPTNPQKVSYVMKMKEKNDACIKFLLMEEKHFIRHMQKN